MLHLAYAWSSYRMHHNLSMSITLLTFSFSSKIYQVPFPLLDLTVLDEPAALLLTLHGWL